MEKHKTKTNDRAFIIIGFIVIGIIFVLYSNTNDFSIINKIKCKNAIKKANKLMNGYGRLLIRKSGTEPKIRIMGESHNKK